ncbi:uncharacterized protein LOC110229242 [Arabidopsis lyrata subsp. lyrata]|uniref:uncharacterized protein LOC110229242 n=1 Tax=Arabidopsis lyrata subsp. lyrata TaxID=81972 RepID=UPI000A29A627|nr:uncharacterized protein LOC110229242 [Arabidopsis lyrata subsp. lyrata]|eukprot:XP_020884646.1 uncharacterized protein LOC110229242 [Arabidopsis lyrata subsp. lyrata]
MDDEIEVEEIGERCKGHLVQWISLQQTSIQNLDLFQLARQQNINDALWKEKLHKVQQYISRWVYASGVPFNSIANDEFKMMVEAIGQFGPGVTPPKSLDEAHTGGYIFEYVKGCIEEIGEENVVQVVTDNAANNMSAAKIMKEIKPSIFWTSCGTHSINLMLESISRLPRFKSTIQMAKEFTIFMYAHHKTLAMMRSFTNKRDIVRPGFTRFASSFLTLQSLLDKRDKLTAMFSSMLRLVDGDKKPTMGLLHGELMVAKKEISDGLKNVEKNVKPILNIIEERIKGRLDNLLHLTGYLLNPYHFYKDSSKATDDEISNAVFKCVDAFFPNDLTTQCQVINSELAIYKNKEGNFGKQWAILCCEKEDYDPEMQFLI